MASTEEPALLTGPASPRLSIVAWLGTLGALSFVAVATGGFVGINLVERVKGGLRDTTQVEIDAAEPHYAGGTGLRELPPIITNLAEPSDAWIRLQGAIIFDGKTTPAPEADAARIAEDILAFLRTLSIDQISGASALQHLREDLNERAFISSQGRVRELVIQTLVVQ